MERTRELLQSAVAGLAKLGLIVSLMVLGAVLMTSAAHGQDAGTSYLPVVQTG